MEGVGFEPTKAEPSDLQSDPFDHSGTPPSRVRHNREIGAGGQHLQAKRAIFFAPVQSLVIIDIPPSHNTMIGCSA